MAEPHHHEHKSPLGLGPGGPHTSEGEKKIVSIHFEVFGKVHELTYQEAAATEAKRLSVTGVIEHTPEKTIKGEMEGTQTDIDAMKTWLQSGYPDVVERVEFSNEKYHERHAHSAFIILKK